MPRTIADDQWLKAHRMDQRRAKSESLPAIPILDGEILEPHEHDRIEGEAAKNRLKDALRATFDQVSINHYLAVFGAVPNRRPARQWLCEGHDTYIHIADVWNDPELRKRIVDRLWRRRAYKLLFYVQRDLEYLDRFAGRPLPPPLDAREIEKVRRMLERHAK